MRQYIWNVLVAIDQLLNTFIGGFPDETLSSRVGRGAIKGNKVALIAEKGINFVFALLGEEDHCRKSVEWEEFETP